MDEDRSAVGLLASTGRRLPGWLKAFVRLAAQALSAEQTSSFRKAFSVCLEAKSYLVKF